jgi:chorismate mutase-like protein
VSHEKIPVPAGGPAPTLRELEELRAELDRIDVALREHLRARIECCIRIGQLKRVHNVPMMQPQRINLVHERAGAFAEQHGIDREFMRQFYDLVIAETCRIEEIVIAAADPQEG